MCRIRTVHFRDTPLSLRRSDARARVSAVSMQRVRAIRLTSRIYEQRCRERDSRIRISEEICLARGHLARGIGVTDGPDVLGADECAPLSTGGTRKEERERKFRNPV